MPWRNDQSFKPNQRSSGPSLMDRLFGYGPSPVERIVGILCYLTSGIAGIIYIIINRSHQQSDFFRFHFLQSIVLGIMSMLLGWALQASAMILGPLIGMLLQALSGAGIVIGSVAEVLNFGMWIFYLLPLYGAVMAGLGKYAPIPLLSDVVRNQMR